MPYEGWSNRETWNIALWLNNTEGDYRYCMELAEKHKTKTALGKALKENYGQVGFGDTPASRMNRVHWSEVAESFLPEH
jgi:hypothetical protein